MIDEIDAINQILPETPSGDYHNYHEYDAGGKALAIRRWIERVLAVRACRTCLRHFLNEAATTLELALWKKSLHESDQVSGVVERAGESIAHRVKMKKRKASEITASVPARAECRVGQN